MHRIMERPLVVYSIFLLFSAALSIVLTRFGYHFIIYNEMIWFVLAVLIELTLISLCAAKNKSSSRTSKIVSQLLPLFSFIYIYVTDSIVHGVNITLLALNGLICFISCFAVSFQYESIRVLRIMCAVLNSILLLLLLAVSFLAMTFGHIGQRTVVHQIISPSKAYTAILIDSDQGASGGSTLAVIEHNNSEVNVLFGRFIRTTRIYAGKWGESETVNLEWQDDNTLLISGEPHSVESFSCMFSR